MVNSAKFITKSDFKDPMKTVKEISILVGASIIAAFAVNYFSPAGIALVGQWDTAKGVITANEKKRYCPQRP
jgi:hypothetical protein